MSKTTREIAELFGVTKQAIEKRYTPEFKAKYMSKEITNGVPTWLVSDEGLHVLKSMFRGTNSGTNSGTNQPQTGLQSNKFYEKQIESLQKLLDQSQQLLLNEQKQNQLLLEKNTDEPSEWEQEKEKLENMKFHFQKSAEEANQRAVESYKSAIYARKLFWVATAIAGILLVLLFILGWIHFFKLK